MDFKLGRQPFIEDHRDLKLSTYLDTTVLPPPPASFGHQGLITNWGMLGNDSVGDCTCAGADHGIMLWTAEGSGSPAPFTTANTIADYSAITGYNPSNPSSDQGAQIRDVLSYMQKTGMIDSTGKRHKIGAYVGLDHTKMSEVLEALYLFSVVEIGINFPDTAMNQFNSGKPWTVISGAMMMSGHDVPLVGYDGTWLYCITWGKLQKMDINFFKTYCEEAWAKLSPEFLNGQGLSPEGFNLAQLQTDLAEIVNPTPAPVVTACKEGWLYIGKTEAIIDGKLTYLDQAPIVDPNSNRTLVPMRFMAENMGYKVDWDENAQSIHFYK